MSKLARFLFGTAEGCMILGATSFAVGAGIGLAIDAAQVKREKKMFDAGIKVGVELNKMGYSTDAIETVVEQEPGIFGKRHIRVVHNNLENVNIPESSDGESNSTITVE